ncbi:MAG: RimK family alpha-L-glutamate ligase [Methanocellales archaeon]
MERIGCFVESYNFANAGEVTALYKFKEAARNLGYDLKFIRKRDLDRIASYRAVFIRAYTMVGNSAYLAARMAELKGIPVIDDSRSILTCCDKIHQHILFLRNNVAIPRTKLYRVNGCCFKEIEECFSELGKPIVIKAPHSSFSKQVARAYSVEDFLRIVKSYSRYASMVLLQQYIETKFDWRIGVLNGKPIYACKYIFPEGSWKMLSKKYSKQAECTVEGVSVSNVPKKVLKEAIKAARTMGRGLYGVDVKQLNGRVYVIEVNENPTIESGYEDTCNPELYEQIIEYLLSLSPAKA